MTKGLSGARLSERATASLGDLSPAPNAFVGFNDKLVAFLQLILSNQREAILHGAGPVFPTLCFCL